MVIHRPSHNAILLDRALYGYEGQTDVLKLVGKGGLYYKVLQASVLNCRLTSFIS